MKPPFEFRLSRQARQKYDFEDELFSTDGHLILSHASASPGAGLQAARRLAARIHAVSGRLVPASALYGMALLHEVMHLLIREYEKQAPHLMSGVARALQSHLGPLFEATLWRFGEEFPSLAVYRGKSTVQEDPLSPSTPPGQSRREAILEEMLLVHLANSNPALQPYRELVDDRVLHDTAYSETVQQMRAFFAQQPPFAMPGTAGGETLDEVLSAPLRAAPHSLEGQLQFILRRWGALLGAEVIQRILRGLDFIREDAARQAQPVAGRPTLAAPLPHGEATEEEHFSPEQEWMARLVLISKNTYVWLEQLSRKYQRWIHHLDQIPDEELDELARRGINGLWLIGLWERSPASRAIKQRMGNPEAAASPYSIYRYEIAEDLGGWEALSRLRARTEPRGLRLAADMVPNHMGIDSIWVIEHPDWFLSVSTPPYPSYTFHSENLSTDPRAQIILEDHYYSRSDAAVVFKHVDTRTAQVRYIYHGNDGTSLPWNDTAQLDFTKPEVRQAVLETILHVARHFPILRLDAAMTLTRRHFQRLWFPEAGTGGAIPSRAEQGMSKAEFEARMPREFWREVVERLAAESPDTLLLAEAFWMMEGYFVRSLGMHRVYNSAFMHMLRDEENAQYRRFIKNTLEWEARVLKRYVNFMSNPDEGTAIEQFGDGDKYFGVCTLMCTLPGLPMFGHGQIEGLREKYGMEFRRPQQDESPHEGLVREHERRIFPLLRRRYLFADVEQFSFYDLHTPQGAIHEDVFAYSNRCGDERALIVYNNKFAEARGWIHAPAARLKKPSGERIQRTLAEGLGLPHEGYVVFRDHADGTEYVRPCREIWEKGLYIELGAYQCKVFMDVQIEKKTPLTPAAPKAESPRAQDEMEPKAPAGSRRATKRRGKRTTKKRQQGRT